MNFSIRHYVVFSFSFLSFCLNASVLYCQFSRFFLLCTLVTGHVHFIQVRICREKTTGHVYAMKKLKKSEMLRRGQVCIQLATFDF